MIKFKGVHQAWDPTGCNNKNVGCYFHEGKRSDKTFRGQNDHTH